MDRELIASGIFSRAIERAPTPMLLLNAEGVIGCVNDAASAILNCDSESLLGRKLVEFLSAPHDQALSPGNCSVLFSSSEQRPDLAADVYTLTDDDAEQNLESLVVIHERGLNTGLSRDEIEKRLDVALNLSDIGIWDWCPQTDSLQRYGSWQSTWMSPNGTAIETGAAMVENLHPADVELARKAMASHLKGDSDIYEVKHRTLNQDGQYEYVHARGKIVERDANGAPTRVLGTYTNIREQELLHQRLNILLERGIQGIWEWETATDQLSGSDISRAEDSTVKFGSSMTSDEFLGHLEPDQVEKMTAAMRAMVKGESDRYEVQFRVARKDGNYDYFLARGVISERRADGHVERVIGTYVNITDIIDANETLHIALENGRQGTWVWHPQQDAVEISSHWYTLFGYPQGSISRNRSDLSPLVHPDDIERSREQLIPMLKGERDDYSVQMRFRHADGHYIWVLSRGRCVERSSDGKATRIVGSHVDITATRQHQDQLQQIADAFTSGKEVRLLNALAQAAAQMSNMQFAAITLLGEDMIGTVTACYPADAGLSGYSYHVPSSPCGFSLEQDTQIYRDQLMETFPDEPTVTGAGLASYVGRRLVDTEGNTLGIFALMDTKPIPDERDVLAVLEIFAARASVELQREQTHTRLAQQEARLDAAMNNSELIVWEWDEPSDRYAVYEPRGTQFGTPAKTGVERLQQVHPDDVHKVGEGRTAYFRGQTDIYEYEVRLKDSEGNYRWYMTRGKANAYTDKGRVKSMIGTHSDITDFKLAQEHALKSQAFLELVIDNVPEYVFWLDQDLVYQGCNAQFARLAGLSHPDDIVGKSSEELGWLSQADMLSAPDLSALQSNSEIVRREQRLALPDGEARWFEINRVPMLDTSGNVVGMLGTMRDITERKSAEEEIQRLAFFDPLTDLPNRRYLIDRLQAELASAERHQRFGALLFIDLDQFKQINDTQGHSVGDELLQAVASRLRRVTRREDTVARLGGDEFVVLLPSLGRSMSTAAGQGETTAEKIKATLTSPYDIAGQVFRVTPTIGIAMFPEADKGVDEVLKEADTAMYSGKAEGRNAIRFFHRHMEDAARQQMQMEHDLRAALESSQLTLHYQPQVDRHGHVVGAEALLRWYHPEKGAIPPSDFIPIAEERGIILELGQWVIAQACRDFVAWREAGKDEAVGAISINVSPRQFRDPNFVTDVTRLLSRYAVPPGRIILEITESAVLENIDEAMQRMSELKQLGVRFALDDFGVGYSSLSYLKALPIDQVKIDQSFIRDIGSDPDDEVICCTIIAMGEQLGLQIVAEGVETEAQLEFLKNNFCDAYQGYFFHKPAPADVFLDYCVASQI